MPRSVLITGCSAGGIGSALVEAFHAKNVHVYATARSKAKMDHLKNLPNVTLLELDVVSPASIKTVLDAVRMETETLDFLINNAGQSLVMPTLDVSIDEAKRLFDVNLWGVVAVTQAFTPLVLAAKGTIVNVCSISAYLHAPWMSIYSASKAALMSYSETLRLEVEPFGVKVISLVTGAVATNVMSHSNITLPASSLYKNAIKEIQKRGIGGDVSSKTLPADFANAVVRDVLDSGRGPIWRGAMTSIVRFMSIVLPVSILDRALKPSTGLENLP